MDSLPGSFRARPSPMSPVRLSALPLRSSTVRLLFCCSSVILFLNSSCGKKTEIPHPFSPAQYILDISRQNTVPLTSDMTESWRGRSSTLTKSSSSDFWLVFPEPTSCEQRSVALIQCQIITQQKNVATKLKALNIEKVNIRPHWSWLETLCQGFQSWIPGSSPGRWRWPGQRPPQSSQFPHGLLAPLQSGYSHSHGPPPGSLSPPLTPT